MHWKGFKPEKGEEGQSPAILEGRDGLAPSQCGREWQLFSPSAQRAAPSQARLAQSSQHLRYGVAA